MHTYFELSMVQHLNPKKFCPFSFLKDNMSPIHQKSKCVIAEEKEATLENSVSIANITNWLCFIGAQIHQLASSEGTGFAATPQKE